MEQPWNPQTWMNEMKKHAINQQHAQSEILKKNLVPRKRKSFWRRKITIRWS
jgi:hypothetical protein